MVHNRFKEEYSPLDRQSFTFLIPAVANKDLNNIPTKHKESECSKLGRLITSQLKKNGFSRAHYKTGNDDYVISKNNECMLTIYPNGR